MIDASLYTAFAMGILTAVSLPMGTLTTVLWKPSERVVALMMAFGGGALLAALTIDLVGSALDQGQFPALALGCLLGGMLFDVLNHTINGRGGFLRKSSTLMHYMARQRQRRFRHILQDMGRLPVFRDLPPQEAQLLAGVVYTEELEEGEEVYEAGDPPDALYVVDAGEVALHDPHNPDAPAQCHGVNESFGRLAFFTGTPYHYNAVARRETRLWVLDSEDLARILPICPVLARQVLDYLESDEVTCCLRERFGLGNEPRREWLRRAVTSLQLGEPLPSAVEPESDDGAADRIAEHIQRLPIFASLSDHDRDLLARHLFLKPVRRGEALFRQGDAADRLYILEDGEVTVVHADEPGRNAMRVSPGSAFGGLSFVTNTRHTATAVATTDAAVWVLRRASLERLLREVPAIGERLSAFLKDEQVSSYLRHKHHFDAERAVNWSERAARSVELSGSLPPRAEMTSEMRKHAGAPMAIWLGITLDGIPESLVIGASMIHNSFSLSLLAGLFLSNYPEALSSSMGMRQQGMRLSRVLLMWSSVTLITGIGAALGSLFFTGAGHGSFALVEGIAAGAMLVMIAETMLPEAYLRGGWASGYTTLLGFLAAIFFKTLE